MSNKQFNLMLALVLATLCAATLNAFCVFGDLSAPWLIQAETFTIHVNRHFFLPRTRIFIGVTLLICAAAFWLRSKKGLIISASALACVELAYANWLARTYSEVRNAEASSYAKIEHLVYLGGANWLDVLVWVGCTIILLWVVVALARARVGWRGKMTLA